MQLFVNHKNDNLQINTYRNNGVVCGNVQEFIESMTNNEEATMALDDLESSKAIMGALEDGSLWADTDDVKCAIESLHYTLSQL